MLCISDPTVIHHIIVKDQGMYEEMVFCVEPLILLYGHSVILVLCVQEESADAWHRFAVHSM